MNRAKLRVLGCLFILILSVGAGFFLMFSADSINEKLQVTDFETAKMQFDTALLQTMTDQIEHEVGLHAGSAKADSRKPFFIAVGMNQESKYIAPPESMLENLRSLERQSRFESVSNCFRTPQGLYEDGVGVKGTLVFCKLIRSSTEEIELDFYWLSGPLGGYSKEGVTYDRKDDVWTRTSEGKLGIY